MGLLALVDWPVTWVKCRVLYQVAGESCPTPAERMSWLSWGIIGVEKEVFYEQDQHRGREGGGGVEGLHRATGRGGNIREGSFVPMVALCWGQPPAGTSKGCDCVCLYSLVSPVGGGLNSSWPHCVSFGLLWHGAQGPQCIQGSTAGTKKSNSTKKWNESYMCPCLSIRVCSSLVPGRICTNWEFRPGNFSFLGHL